MTKWSAVLLFALMILVGCGGGGGGGGTSGGSGGGGEECVALELPDYFERSEGVLSGHCSEAWLPVAGYAEFQVLDGSAVPTSPRTNPNDGINVNIWHEEFGQNQMASFTIDAIPTIVDNSSLGLLLRIDLITKNGYLVTFVPQIGNDVIRIWQVVDGNLYDGVVQIGGDIDFGGSFMLGDTFQVTAQDDEICVLIEENNTYELIDCRQDNNYIRGGHIGIYAVDVSGAIDVFDGGPLP